MSASIHKNLFPRPPIVVVVGHVDHGKTSLLDYLRKTNVVAKEAGGITQSIGAYEIIHLSHELRIDAATSTDKRGLNISANQRGQREPGAFTEKNVRDESAPAEGRKITFIDTPGHEAFSEMRVRGANIADLAILVVAADEGVKPQTIEAIKALNNANTPFIVAITKIDKTNANVDKVKNELLSQGVFLEGFGGNISWQPISVKTGEGINELLDLVVLMGDLLGLTYDPKTPASGYVLESLKDDRRGIIAHLILKNGILNIGDEIASPSASGKIKILEDFTGKSVNSLEPSAPAVVVGFSSIPEAGDEFRTGPEAKKYFENLKKPTVEAVVKKSGEGDKFKLLLKADTSGSLEALRGVLGDEFEVVEVSVGNITDGDVKNAIIAGGVIVGFRVKVERAAKNLAQAHNVEIITSDIIYHLVEILDARLKASEAKTPTAELLLLKIFSAAGRRQIIGGRVLVGSFKRNIEVKVERAGVIVGDGRVLNVQIEHQDVQEAQTGAECGLLFESDTIVRAGDKLQVFGNSAGSL
jgi:translation initiation factor IF-2